MDDSIEQRCLRAEQQYEGSEFAEILHPITTYTGTYEMTPMKQIGEALSGSPTKSDVGMKPHAQDDTDDEPWCSCGNQLPEQLH